MQITVIVNVDQSRLYFFEFVTRCAPQTQEDPGDEAELAKHFTSGLFARYSIKCYSKSFLSRRILYPSLSNIALKKIVLVQLPCKKLTSYETRFTNFFTIYQISNSLNSHKPIALHCINRLTRRTSAQLNWLNQTYRSN